MSERAECIVIGGGIIGASIAYHLTRLGCRDVVLLEKDYLASKATSVCPGGIRSQWQDEAACLYARESVRFFERIDEELHPEFPLPFRQTGYLFLAHSPSTFELFRKNVALQNRLEIASELLLPADIETIVESVRRTGRCVIVHEASRFGGFGAELSALVQERCFHYLRAPIERVAGWDTPYPHAFEWDYFPGPARVLAALQRSMEP